MSEILKESLSRNKENSSHLDIDKVIENLLQCRKKKIGQKVNIPES